MTDAPDYTDVPEAEPDPCRGIPRWRYMELWTELADGTVKQAALGRKYGVSRQAVSQFAKRHRGRIEEIRAKLGQEFAGLWIADKRRRIEALQADYEASAANEFYSDHYEQVRVRMQILRAVAEELGEIPTKSTVHVGGVVEHRLVGVNIDECFPRVPDTVPEALTSRS